MCNGPRVSPSQAGSVRRRGGCGQHVGPHSGRVQMPPSARSLTWVSHPSLRPRVPRTVQGTPVIGPTARSHSYVPSPPRARWLPCCPARALLSGRGPGWHQRHLRATPGTVVRAGQGQGRCAGLFCVSVSAQGPDQTSPRLLPSLPAGEQQPGAQSGMRGRPRENAECEMCRPPALALPVP